jgi:hypothetical protein
VVNDSYRLAPAHHLYACDYRWWEHHIADILRDFEGNLWTQDVQWEQQGKPVDPAQWGITKLTSIDAPGLSKKQGVIHRGDNSGYQALNLALLLGAERIILLGFDMMLTGKQRHWFGDHPEHMNVASNYPSLVQHFATIKPADYGLEIWNCSRRTALSCFPKHDLDECLALL